MRSMFRSAVSVLAAMTLLTGVLYPVAITLVGRTLFAGKTGGSLVREGDRIVGSRLIGQPFDDPRYFHGRPSATGPFPYNGAASTGSNLGPSNPALHEAVRARLDALRESNPEAGTAPPVDLVTASGSGLDPHISPAAAFYQADRVARARGLDPETVRALVTGHVEDRTFRLLGEPRVNVLMLNLALDRRSGAAPLPAAGKAEGMKS